VALTVKNCAEKGKRTRHPTCSVAATRVLCLNDVATPNLLGANLTRIRATYAVIKVLFISADPDGRFVQSC
jgi:hypothetical protein